MKKIAKKVSGRLFAALAFLMMAPAAAMADDFEFKTLAENATSALSDTIRPVIGIVQMIIALMAVVMLMWNYIKRSKNDGQSNDALAAWGYSLLIALAGLQVVKMVFLR